jgi:hypothetical protein
MPCTLPHMQDGGVEGCMEQNYNTKHAEIDLPAHFMIVSLERAVMGKIKLLDSAAVPA